MIRRGPARIFDWLHRTTHQCASYLWWTLPVQRIRRIVAWVVLFLLAEAALWFTLALVYDRAGPRVGDRLFVALVLIALAILLRRPLWRVVRKMWVKHRFRRAVVDAKLITERNRVPAAYKMTEEAAGDRLVVGIPSGMSVDDLERSSERLAVTLGAREVRVTRRPEDARLADVLVVRRDPLVELAALPWPWSDVQQTTVWAPVPVGVSEDGDVVEMALPEHNLLLGGEPGGGKSAALSQLVAAAALDPDVRLWLLDGKVVELAAWSHTADASVGIEIDDAIDLLRDIQSHMDRRFEELLEEGIRKIHPLLGWPLHVVVCDELAHYLTTGTKKQSSAFTDVLRDLISRGRAAGIVVLAATQKPSSDVVPTSVRDLFGFRWAFRCASPQASDTILGQGWASQGYSASTIDPGLRGVGWLLHEGGVPVRVRSYWLDDDTVRELARRAAALRRGRVEEVPS